MASLHTSIIWIVYAILVTVLIGIASIFIYVYQTPRDRSPSVTITCIFAITTLLATVMLLPADVALVSSTSLPKLGRRKAWATQDEVDTITFSLTIVYYFLYSLDAFLCLILIPFTYFWYEEYDELGEQSTGQRFWNALKYTLCFIAIVSVLFLVGFFAPVSKNRDDVDLDYFRRLLLENHGERALTFALGLLITIGVCIYVLYTSSGLALLPVKLIKTAPSLSNPTVKSTTAVQLESNRERQRQLEGRCGGDFGALSSKDRRELEVLVRKERTLIRQQRLAEESQGNGRGWLMKAWYRLEAIFRPVKLLGGIVLLLLGLTTWTSMLLTGIDKATNSICKHRCGYILGHINVFNPLNWVLVESAKIFPMDYAIFTVLVLLFFCGSVVGIAAIGIRFLWIRIFQIRKGHTSPQALLVATVMMVLIILALNYSISMLAAPQYATFGPQTFCDRPNFLGWQPNCSSHEDLVKPCSELANNPAAKSVCTPSVASTFFNRVTLNFPFFGDVIFWAQFVFLGVYIITTVTSLIRTPKLDERQIDEDGEEEEEEGLLASTGRRFNANWQDITGRSDRQ